jgi:RNA polymerase sigma-B factor
MGVIAGHAPARSGARGRQDTLRLFERYQRERRAEDRDELVRRHVRLADSVAARYRTRAEDDDLRQVAAMALVKAVDRFDPTRGIAFSSYAVPTILGELKRYFRDLGWSVRVPRHLQDLILRMDGIGEELTSELGRAPTADELARACNASREDVLEARAAASAHFAESLDRPKQDAEDDDVRERLVETEDPGYARAEQTADLDRMLSCLSERERTIVRLRFQEDMVQREIGACLGISQMQVSRLLKQAMSTLQGQSPPAANRAALRSVYRSRL